MAKNKRMLVSMLVVILGLVIIFIFINFKNSDSANDAVKTENKVETKSEENNKSADQNIQKGNDEATPDVKLDSNQEIRESNDYQDAPEQADTEVDFEE